MHSWHAGRPLCKGIPWAVTASQSAQALTQLPARSLHPATCHAAHTARAHRVGRHSHLGAGRQDLSDVGVLLGLPHALTVVVAPVCGPLVTLPAGADMELSLCSLLARAPSVQPSRPLLWLGSCRLQQTVN